MSATDIIQPAAQAELQTAASSRRTFLRTVASTALLGAVPSIAWSHTVVGIVRPPLMLPDVRLTRENGSSTTLQSLLRGKATALQMMFTGCSATCPLQGALFATVQQRLAKQPDRSIQLISLSIDPLGDDVPAMKKWLRQFNAGANWTAVVPAIKDLDRMRKALEKSDDDLNDHTNQIFLFDRKGFLVWRTEDLPPADSVVKQLLSIARA